MRGGGIYGFRVLTTILTIYRFGLRGKYGLCGTKKHGFRTKKHEKARKKRQKTDAFAFGTSMPQVRTLSLRPKKKRYLTVSFLFCLMCQFEAVLRSKMQVRIPRSEIDKLACQAKCVGITERSEVTLSLRPKNKREDRPLFSFLLDVSI